MSYFMQPKQSQYQHLDEIGSNISPAMGSMSSNGHPKFTMKDPLKLSDIEGAAPAQIPGYTGAKVHKMLSRTQAVTNYGPSLKSQRDIPMSSWKKVTNSFGRSSMNNPSAYKDDFNYFVPK